MTFFIKEMLILKIFLSCLFIATPIFASQPEVRPFGKPQTNFEKILEKRLQTNFDSLNVLTRSAGPTIYKRLLPSVVKVLTNEGHGTGIVISTKNNGYILTNYHVVEGYRTVGLVFSDSEGEKETPLGRVVKFDAIRDLALVKISSPRSDIFPISIKKSPPEIGDDVHALGHPLGEDWTYTRGYVSQKREDFGWSSGVGKHHVADVIQTQTPINPGNSGGPLVDNNAEMVGINSFGSSRGEGINFAIAVSSFYDFLDEAENRNWPSIPEELSNNLIFSLDENNNGVIDVYVWDENDNQIADLIGFDRDEDFVIEELEFDENENDVVELRILWKIVDSREVAVYFIDKDEDGNDDIVGVDVDLDGEIDKTFPAED